MLFRSGPDLPEAQRLAKSLGLADDIEFLGAQDQIVPLLSAADVFLLPSMQESFGLAALEAMACEVPVVAFAVGGVPEVVGYQGGEFLCAPGDLDSMAAVSLRLLTDADYYRATATAARAAAREHFCDSKIVPLYERCYERALLAE